MNIGIVGSEAAKFTPKGEQAAKDMIHAIIERAAVWDGEIPCVVSGECHLGGIDIWARDIALDLNVGYIGYPPKEHNWSNGYKPRNLQIARASDVCYCITVDRLPANYTGMKFNGCYHCAKGFPNNTPHVKSGGCWTVLQAQKMGKDARWIVVNNE